MNRNLSDGGRRPAARPSVLLSRKFFLTKHHRRYIVHFMNYMEVIFLLDEDLLFAWLQLGCVIDNQRLVSQLSFNEALVCGLLYRADAPLTASDLCARTHILKSQMNAILRSLEKKGYLQRSQSQEDRRQIHLRLLPEGVERYTASHRRTLALVDRLIDSVGEEQIRALIPLLQTVTDHFDQIIKEV